MKILFMGTPDFAVGVVEALEREGHEILVCVTQPDKPTGRTKALTPPPVKVWADERGIPVLQPKRVRDPEFIAMLSEVPYDIGVVAAYGQILPEEILTMPAYGCINVHASLLPKYRGASPIQWSILNGDKVTGVTIMAMGPGLDDGDILMQEEVEIDEEETGGSLFEKLSIKGSNLCCFVLNGLMQGIIGFMPQDEAQATYVTTLKKEDGLIDFNKDSAYISRQIRAFDPWPSAYTSLNGNMLKIWKSHPISQEEIEGCGIDFLEAGLEAPAGCVTYVDDEQIIVRCGSGCLSIMELQLSGKKRMRVHDFLLGNKVLPGTMFGKQ